MTALTEEAVCLNFGALMISAVGLPYGNDPSEPTLRISTITPFIRQIGGGTPDPQTGQSGNAPVFQVNRAILTNPQMR